MRPMFAAVGGWQWIEDHSSLLWWMGAVSIGTLVLAALLLPVLVVRLDPLYFVAARAELARRRRPLELVLHIGKNVLGIVLVLAGVLMLVLPGQGLLTILIGMLLVDFPGKRRIELRIVRRPAILRMLNAMRAKRGRPPLVIEPAGPEPDHRERAGPG